MPSVLIVQRGANAVAEEPADRGADQGSSKSIAAAGEQIADKRASRRASDGTVASFGPVFAAQAARLAPIKANTIDRLGSVEPPKSPNGPKELHWGETLLPRPVLAAV